MKRFIWSVLALALALGVLASCGGTGAGDPVPGGASSGEEPVGGETARPAAVSTLCRVVTADNGTLLLAEEDGGRVYTLALGQTPVTLDGASASAEDLEPGMLAEVCYEGDVLETYPAAFSGVTSVNGRSDGFDDMAALYLDVLETLWQRDEGLNGDVRVIGVDLSATRLPESQRGAVAWAFASAHGAEAVTGTFDELVEQGYITVVENDPQSDGIPGPYWEDGCLFTITEQELEGVYSLNAVSFDAQKWRTPLGAYYLCDCKAAQTALGRWDGFTIGGEAIS